MSEKIVAVDPKVLAGLDNYLNLPALQQPTWPDQSAVAAVRVHRITLLRPRASSRRVPLRRAARWRNQGADRAHRARTTMAAASAEHIDAAATAASRP